MDGLRTKKAPHFVQSFNDFDRWTVDGSDFLLQPHHICLSKGMMHTETRSNSTLKRVDMSDWIQ